MNKDSKDINNSKTWAKHSFLRLPWCLSGKQSACEDRIRFYPWVRKMPWRRKQQPTPIFLPGKSHGQRSLVGYSPWGRKKSDTTITNTFSSSLSLAGPRTIRCRCLQISFYFLYKDACWSTQNMKGVSSEWRALPESCFSYVTSAFYTPLTTLLTWRFQASCAP